MQLKERTKQIITTQHIPKECAPQHLQVIKVNTWSIFIELAGWFPALKSPYLISKNQEKFEKNIWDVFKNTRIHLTIIQQKQDKITLYLEMVRDDSLKLNSIMQDCFTIRLWAKRLCRCTPRVTSWPRTPHVSLLHSRGMCALSRSCADRERANCCGLYAKRQWIILAAIKAIYSRDNILRLYFMSSISMMCCF